MTPRQVQLLLNELCVVLGFCLPRDAQARLEQNPGSDIDAFTDAVIMAEGLDPQADIPLNLRRDIRVRVAKHFQAVDDET